MTKLSVKGKKRVNFSMRAEPNSKIYVAGTFNDWDPKKHKLQCANGVYSTSILLDAGRHEYKFIVDDVWCIDPECVEWTPNGCGSLNSVIVVE